MACCYHAKGLACPCKPSERCESGSVQRRFARRTRDDSAGKSQFQDRDGAHLTSVGNRVLGNYLYRCDGLRLQNLSCPFSRRQHSRTVRAGHDCRELPRDNQCVGPPRICRSVRRHVLSLETIPAVAIPFMERFMDLACNKLGIQRNFAEIWALGRQTLLPLSPTDAVLAPVCSNYDDGRVQRVLRECVDRIQGSRT